MSPEEEAFVRRHELLHELHRRVEVDSTETVIITDQKRKAVVDLLYILNPTWSRDYTEFVARGIWLLLREVTPTTK
jgi:hypothetical protein